MQKPINELVSEVIRVINTPPSRPIRLMFLENEIFYEMAQNQVKELFASNEIINMTNFMDFEAWKSRVRSDSFSPYLYVGEPTDNQ